MKKPLIVTLYVCTWWRSHSLSPYMCVHWRVQWLLHSHVEMVDTKDESKQCIVCMSTLSRQRIKVWNAFSAMYVATVNTKHIHTFLPITFLILNQFSIRKKVLKSWDWGLSSHTIKCYLCQYCQCKAWKCVMYSMLSLLTLLIQSIK